ncbi:MAG TPA: DUF1223 domain-containing protein [Elusimicrobiota bacterium]|jgi:hypothetical protein|nr:DUF1223 domain-containing protein [Elusimicrobiota bacterium]
MIALPFALALASNSFAAEWTLRSGPARTHVVELYSSEGCSSCPPADDWIASLLKARGLWKDFVPVVFHVTYWDYLGWKDRFAEPAFDARQRAYAAAWGAASTYTPGLVLDGEEWRGWGGAPPEATRPAGILTARITAGRISARFSPAAGAGPFIVYAARLGFGASSDVAAGENAGRVLRHEFVVLGLARAPMKRTGGAWAARLALPPASGPPVGREGLAARVAGPDGRPAQAAGGFFP